MNRTAAEWKQAFDDAVAEKVALEAEAEELDKKVGDLRDKLLTVKDSKTMWTLEAAWAFLKVIDITQDLDE